MRRKGLRLGHELDVVPHPSDIIRFMQKVRVVDGCWQWTGSKDKNGYGQFWLRTSRGGLTVKGKRKCRGGAMIGAHRYAVALFKGRILAGNDADHCATEECIGHDCVHPFKCLEQKTRQQNGKDGRKRQLAATRRKRDVPKWLATSKRITADIPF